MNWVIVIFRSDLASCKKLDRTDPTRTNCGLELRKKLYNFITGLIQPDPFREKKFSDRTALFWSLLRRPSFSRISICDSRFSCVHWNFLRDWTRSPTTLPADSLSITHSITRRDHNTTTSRAFRIYQPNQVSEKKVFVIVLHVFFNLSATFDQ